MIGGGATGAACALDAQLRGLKTVLLDASDFAGATSSASTKLIHGGVRYLEQAFRDFDPAQYRLVKRALRERTLMLKNGPYLSRVTEFLVPCSGWKDAAYYDVGMKLYDRIAGDAKLSPSHFLNRSETSRKLPTLNSQKLVGSVVYADGQFDDARYNIALVLTYAEAGGEALNYARVTAFEKDAQGRLVAAEIEDQSTRCKYKVRARAFVNATGPFSDGIRTLANPGASPRIRPSKGVHILLPLEVMPGDAALLIPKTEDGRVLFAIPWMGRLLVGTTDMEVSAGEELYVTKEEVDYLLRHLNLYLTCPVAADQIVSGTAGMRPLVGTGDNRDTRKLARDDVLEEDAQSRLISVMGGKWTTHRAMAEDTVNAVQKSLVGAATPCLTRDHALVGSEGYGHDYWQSLKKDYNVSEPTARHLAGKFGTDAPKVLALLGEDSGFAEPVLPGLAPIRVEVAYCARNEMAVTIEDVLFRRLGIQLYNWRSAIHAAPVVGSILARELAWSDEFTRDSVRAYVETINRYLELAGLKPES